MIQSPPNMGADLAVDKLKFNYRSSSGRVDTFLGKFLRGKVEYANL